MSDSNTTYMTPEKTISGSQGTVYVTYSDTNQRFCFARLINVEAKVKLNKTAIAILGKTGKAHKIGSWEGSGTAEMYYCDSAMRKKVAEYNGTGKMFTFDMEITNNDEASTMSAQTTILKGCLLDEIILAKIDAETEVLKESISFTFDDFSIENTFEVR
jgi:hypothetical protein|nr:MAG TPA: tail tube protein [Caudoviricetes sp.]